MGLAPQARGYAPLSGRTVESTTRKIIMAITATINGDDHTGATLLDIVQDLYGTAAYPAKTSDPNAAEWGHVLRRADQSSFTILATITHVEGKEEHLNIDELITQLHTVCEDITTTRDQLDELYEQRAHIMRHLARAGLPKVRIVEITGLSRNQVYQIIKG